MMSARYPAEFKAEAVKQVTGRDHGVVDAAKRLGMLDKSLYLWVRLAKEQSGVGGGENATLKAEVSRLKAELQRANEELDILKQATTYFAKLSGRSTHSWPSISANFDCMVGAAGSTQWLSRLEEKTKVKMHSGPRISAAEDKAIL